VASQEGISSMSELKSKAAENHKINQSNTIKNIEDSDIFKTKIKNGIYFFNVEPVLVSCYTNT
jgi:hypothetical protein